ncbi:hypothetical protein [Streptomyces sp. NPDC047981]|uniref:hypothetical protein n=1 Tax=Streptomyces sp. NPDC047981 TaxID=3154610 RepID=UPI0034190E76
MGEQFAPLFGKPALGGHTGRGRNILLGAKAFGLPSADHFDPPGGHGQVEDGHHPHRRAELLQDPGQSLGGDRGGQVAAPRSGQRQRAPSH